MFLILGLGNPGPEYELTRHNIGFMVIDTLSQKHEIPLRFDGHFCRYGQGEIGGLEVVVAKPMTFMNESGKAVRAITAELKLAPGRVIVVYDEIDLVLGKIKIRHKGGDAGQRGVRSIIRRLLTDQFTRIRVGIDRPENQGDIVDYVLSPFLEDEWPLVNDVLEKAAEKIEITLIELNNKKTQSEEETE